MDSQNGKHDYSYTAIEEALANAVYHKCYDVREPIEVRVLPDRIEIVSHPGAGRPISIDGLKNFCVFNRRIGDFLKEIHLTEGRNTGFGKILRALERNGSLKPLFETDDIRTFLRQQYIIDVFDNLMQGIKNATNKRNTESKSIALVTIA